MAEITIDMSEYDAFFARLKQAGNGAFEKAVGLFFEGLGEEFLRVVQDEIISMGAVNTRLMLASFGRGGGNNVWEVSDGGLKLTVGSTLDYAQYVNDGHWANPGGVQVRFVPGYWSGDTFTYSPGAKGGMILHQQWVEGYHYWESGLNIIEKMMPKLLEAKLQQWLDSYFSGF